MRGKTKKRGCEDATHAFRASRKRGEDTHAFRASRKRGLSPIIATTLLVAIAVVLAVIIFLWARNFIGESIEKNDQAIELICDDVSFVAEIYDNYLHVENTGTVPLHGIEILQKRIIGDIRQAEMFPNTLSISPGETPEPIEVTALGLVSGDTVILVPILLGETNTARKAFICDEGEYGQEIVVG